MTVISLCTAQTAPEAARSFFANGDPGPVASSLAHAPAIMLTALPFVRATLGPSAINIRTKEIVILRASALQQCRYCVNTHSFVARNSGLTKAEVLALRGKGDGTSAFTSEREKALIRWTNAVAVGPQEVPQKLKKEIKEHFTEAEVTELTMLVGATIMLNRYATALDLPVAAPHLEFLQNEQLVFETVS